ncbi:hypothetical protein BHYA_0084g00380 [Botrytis hyacinthi]|uniref:SET domain-containing protein n=1 Tax=Botrytis hyacinthi TaxID=278943 RepID=A0A4Z1GM98_9HELO|nr:hypothetical protein BHYA_0084g00380 [Botrytis hyacinthi]
MHFSLLIAITSLTAFSNAKPSVPFDILDTLSHAQCSSSVFSSANSMCSSNLELSRNKHYPSESSQLLSINSNESNTTLSTSSTPSPWQYSPLCSNITSTSPKTPQFCVYTSTTFASGRGISLLTTPKIASKIASLPGFTSSLPFQPLYNSSNPAPFEIRQLPGRGMGVIATRPIKRGTILFAYPTIGIYHNSAFPRSHNSSSSSSPQNHTSLFSLSATQLPPSTSNLLYSLAAHEPLCQLHNSEGIIGRLNTNTFGEDFLGQEHSIVVPETARLNHDCRPNANYYFDARTLMHYTVAGRDIAVGEEITITYTNPLIPSGSRRSALHHSWGFHCTCPHCLLPVPQRQHSNHLILTILSLQSALEYNSSSPFPPVDFISKSLYLIELYRLEGLQSHIGDGYRSAALAYSVVGREWETRMG